MATLTDGRPLGIQADVGDYDGVVPRSGPNGGTEPTPRHIWGAMRPRGVNRAQNLC